MSVHPPRHGPRARWLSLCTALCAALLVACGSGGAKGNNDGGTGGNVSAATRQGSPAAGGAPCQTPASGAHNDLLVTRDQALYLRDMKSGKETRLFTAPAGQFVTYPTWAPDGRCFLFALDSPFQGNTAANWGSDFYLADADGSNQTLLLQHDQPGAELESPSWTPDGKAIVYAYFLTQYDAQGQYKGQLYEARKLDIASRTPASFLSEANSADLCRTGARLTYVNFNQTDFTSYGIWVADADGKNGKNIVSSQTGMQAFYAPRFSPDCKVVIFAAVGGGGLRRAPDSGGNLIARLLAPFAPAVAEAHGPPWELWRVDADGSNLKRITSLAEDLPFAEWSADGQTVVFLGAGGLYQMAPDGSNIKKIAPGATHGQISWRQK